MMTMLPVQILMAVLSATVKLDFGGMDLTALVYMHVFPISYNYKLI